MSLTPPDINKHYKRVFSVLKKDSQYSFDDETGRFYKAGDKLLYRYNKNNTKSFMHLGHEELLKAVCTKNGRVLYASREFYHSSFFAHESKEKEETHGDYDDIEYYTPSVDLDVLDGVDPFAPETIKAKETAIKFIIEKHKEIAPNSFEILNSIGGAYLEINHNIFKGLLETGKDFELLCRTYNFYLDDLETALFVMCPELKQFVKIDCLNMVKRVFKSPGSIHAKYDYAVVPLDIDKPKIDYKDCEIPLPKKSLDKIKNYYKKFDKKDGKTLLKFLDTYRDEAVKEMTKKSNTSEIYISPVKVEEEDFAPCIKKILNPEWKAAPTRRHAISSSALGCFRWNEKEAEKRTNELADVLHTSNTGQIYKSHYKKINTPSCETLKAKGKGFPLMGLGPDVCKPDEGCTDITNPNFYGTTVIEHETNLPVKRVKRDDIFIKKKDSKGKLVLTEDKQPIISGISTGHLGEFISQQFSFATLNDTEEIFVYTDGVYIKGKTLIKYECQKILGESFTKDRFVTEAENYIKRKTYVDRDKFDTDHNIINLKNGLYHIDRKEIGPHTPDYLSFVQLPIEYDESAICEKWLDYLQVVVVDDEDREILQEFAGWLFVPNYDIPKALIIEGVGGGGKSTYLDTITSLIGSKNVSSISWQDLGDDKYAKSHLYGKMANIHSDLPKTAIKNSNTFQQLTGADKVWSDRKHSIEGIDFHNRAKIAFSTNCIPRAKDVTDAFFDRLLLVSFPNKIRGTKKDDRHFKKKLVKELPGIFNWALVGLDRLNENNEFSSSKSMEEIKELYIKKSDTVIAFFNDKINEGTKEDHEPKDDVYQEYVKYCREEIDSIPIDKNVFGKEFGKQAGWIGSGQRFYTVEGSEKQIRINSWIGFKFPIYGSFKTPLDDPNADPTKTLKSIPSIGDFQCGEHSEDNGPGNTENDKKSECIEENNSENRKTPIDGLVFDKNDIKKLLEILKNESPLSTGDICTLSTKHFDATTSETLSLLEHLKKQNLILENKDGWVIV